LFRSTFVPLWVRDALVIVLAALAAFWRMFGNYFIAVDFAFLEHASAGSLISLDRYSRQFYRPVEDFLWAVFFPVFQGITYWHFASMYSTRS
jgi:hypothetical protein